MLHRFPLLHRRHSELLLTTVQITDCPYWRVPPILKQQIGMIISRHGLVSFITHPDYLLEDDR